jgi:hypothetical protein
MENAMPSRGETRFSHKVLDAMPIGGVVTTERVRTSGVSTAVPTELVEHRSAPPRWASWAAVAIVACVVPANVWRLALAVGAPVGYDDAKLRADFDLPGWGGAAYLVTLVVVIQGFSLVSLGLVQRWGEVVPQWVPGLGDRRIPPALVVVVAGTGAVVMTLLWVPVGVLWWTTETGLNGVHHVVAGMCYFPMVMWGPLLGMLAASYRRRHRDVRGRR